VLTSVITVLRSTLCYSHFRETCQHGLNVCSRLVFSASAGVAAREDVCSIVSFVDNKQSQIPCTTAHKLIVDEVAPSQWTDLVLSGV
jgi:hypothetical protein